MVCRKCGGGEDEGGVLGVVRWVANDYKTFKLVSTEELLQPCIEYIIPNFRTRPDERALQRSYSGYNERVLCICAEHQTDTVQFRPAQDKIRLGG